MTIITPAFAQQDWVIQHASPQTNEEQAREFIAFWHPDGCIVNNDSLPASLFEGIPTVYTHRDPKTLPPQSSLISYDESAIADLAARELLRLKQTTYGFVPNLKREHWCREREACFQRILKVNFQEMALFNPPETCQTTVDFQAALIKWLNTLPKPIGLFATNDKVARQVIDACLHAHLSVPEDVALVGVDNSRNLCERHPISISSIDTDIDSLLRPLIAVLDNKMQRKKTKAEILRVKSFKLVRRASTMRYHDPKVMEALEVIRREACNGISARAIAALFPCCRRMAERRFRHVTGRSILSEINAVRLATAQDLLASGKVKTSEIAAACGYASWNSIRRLLYGTKSRTTARAKKSTRQ